MTKKEYKWSKRFAWLPVIIEDGNPEKFGFYWLTWVDYRWFEGRDGSYWRPATHNWDQ